MIFVMRKLAEIATVQRVMLDPGKDGPELGTGDNKFGYVAGGLRGKDGPELGTGDNRGTST